MFSKKKLEPCSDKKRRKTRGWMALHKGNKKQVTSSKRKLPASLGTRYETMEKVSGAISASETINVVNFNKKPRMRSMLTGTDTERGDIHSIVASKIEVTSEVLLVFESESKSK